MSRAIVTPAGRQDDLRRCRGGKADTIAAHAMSCQGTLSSLMLTCQALVALLGTVFVRVNGPYAPKVVTMSCQDELFGMISKMEARGMSACSNSEGAPRCRKWRIKKPAKVIAGFVFGF